MTPGVNGQAGLLLTASQALTSVSGYGDGLIADPEVVVAGGSMHLWFSSFAESVSTGGRTPLAFGISYAHSTDGVNWTFLAANPLPSLFKPGELAGGQQPAVLYDAGQARFEMWFKSDTPAEGALIPTEWFTAYGFWHATSADGLVWTVNYAARDFAWQPALDYEAYGLLTGCCVVRRDGVDRMYYSSWGTRGIPDPALYLVPLRSGGLTPAVITFNVASRLTLR